MGLFVRMRISPSPQAIRKTFDIRSIDWRARAALLLIALAVPFYAIASFEGTIEVSYGRWFAVHILGAEIAFIGLAAISGLRPQETWRAMPRRIQAVVIGWLLVATSATVFSPYARISGIFQFAWIVHGLFAISLWSMLRGRWAAIRPVLLPLFGVGLLLHSLAVYFVAWAVLGPNLAEWSPYSVGTNNPRMYVFYADALLGLGLGMLVAGKGRRSILFALLLTFAAYHLFAWAGGRAAIGAALLVPALVAIVARQNRVRVLAASYLSAAIALPLTLLTAPTHPTYGFRSILGRIVDNELYGRFNRLFVRSPAILARLGGARP